MRDVVGEVRVDVTYWTLGVLDAFGGIAHSWFRYSVDRTSIVFVIIIMRLNYHQSPKHPRILRLSAPRMGTKQLVVMLSQCW